jgi:hypothetical protein
LFIAGTKKFGGLISGARISASHIVMESMAMRASNLSVVFQNASVIVSNGSIDDMAALNSTQRPVLVKRVANLANTDPFMLTTSSDASGIHNPHPTLCFSVLLCLTNNAI